MSADPSILRNRLGASRSPYLLAHADQPVAWQPWDAESLALARRLERPILLSSGYAACHWCHVMARESFSDPDIAARINAAFLPIKLDREEHPDIDHYYMTALQVMGVPGGWPMTVFLTSDARPFAGGTYYPPAPRHGMPGFSGVLARIATLWRTDRPRLAEIARRVTEATARLLAGPGRPPSDPAAAERTACAPIGEALLGLIDSVHGGFGAAPKFPQVPALRLLWDLRHAPSLGERAREAVIAALAAMAAGGIHDHLGGGFHRYAVDAAWRVPHFEKMLYDNAEILLLLAAVHRSAPAAWLAETANGLVSWAESEMRLPEGGFASALNAESEGREGAFYLWSEEDLKAALGDDFPTFRQIFALPRGGHLDGLIVLNRRHRPHAAGSEEDPEGLRRILDRLAGVRAGRSRPRRDEKAVAAWNGRMITALVTAGAVFNRPSWIRLAEEQLTRLLALLHRPGSGLARHSFRGETGPPATLADHAALAEACLALHMATLAPEWLSRAIELADMAHARFHDPASGLYRLGPAAGLPHAPVMPDEGPLPSGTALLLDVFSRLARILPTESRTARADTLAAALKSAIAGRHPLSVAGCLLALRRHERAAHITLHGPPPARDSAMAALHRVALSGLETGLALSHEDGEKPARAMLCLGRRCLPPVADPDELARELERMHVRAA